MSFFSDILMSFPAIEMSFVVTSRCRATAQL